MYIQRLRSGVGKSFYAGRLELQDMPGASQPVSRIHPDFFDVVQDDQPTFKPSVSN